MPTFEADQADLLSLLDELQVEQRSPGGAQRRRHDRPVFRRSAPRAGGKAW